MGKINCSAFNGCLTSALFSLGLFEQGHENSLSFLKPQWQTRNPCDEAKREGLRDRLASAPTEGFIRAEGIRQDESTPAIDRGIRQGSAGWTTRQCTVRSDLFCASARCAAGKR